MLQVREQEQPDIVGHGKRIAFGVRHHQRRALLIEFDLAVGLDNPGTVICGKAARQKAVGLARQAVGDDGIGEGKIRSGKNQFGMLVGRAAGLAETVIGEGLFAA